MTPLQALLLFCTSVIAGTFNAVAGGGSFFTVPTLIFMGLPALQANTTSTVALLPGSVASAGAYRQELAKQTPGFLILLVGSSLIGSILGSILLLKTSQSTFVLLLPYLLLLATLLFTFSEHITTRLRGRKLATASEKMSLSAVVGVAIGQLIIAIYGGYFGGGIGILMLATLAMMGMENVHSMNALKTILASCINGVAAVTFILAGKVLWPQALLMLVGAIVGGYGGAYFARKIAQKWIRLFVMIVGFTLTIYFFVNTYIHS